MYPVVWHDPKIKPSVSDNHPGDRYVEVCNIVSGAVFGVFPWLQ